MSTAPHERPSRAIQDYAKAIYVLQRRPDAGGGASTSELAARVGVRAASVSAMIRTLAERGLVVHEPYRGVYLTPAGERVALQVLRHHRLLELFLATELGLPWDRVHDEAEKLEHVISDELAACIAQKLGHPTLDPHGDPIPTAELKLIEPATRPLSQLGTGECGVLVRVRDAAADMLRYLTDCEITLGCELRVVGHDPFGGPVTIAVDGTHQQLGRPLIDVLHVAA